MTELEELRLAYAECSRQRFELLAKLKNLLQDPEPVVCNECKEWEKVCDQHLRHIKKLKAKREWQGLTDEEKQDGNCKKCKDGCPACDARRQSNVLP